MSRRSKRLRAPALLIAALAALLVFAATASAAAETRTGESTTASIVGAPSPEAVLVKSTASFETATGSAVISFTTAAPPDPASNNEMIGGFSTQECSSTPPSSFNTESAILPLLASSPLLLIISSPSEQAEGITGTTSSPVPLLVLRSVSGATTTLALASPSLVEAGYKCALIFVEEETGAGSLMTVPIKGPPPPPPAPVVAPAPAPLPAPAVLSVAKPKPLKVKAKTWKTVHVKVSNTGATATTQGSLRVKAAKGALVKPEVQKLPVLTPGATFTLSVRVQLTGTAKPTSKLPVTVTAPGVSATGSIVLKLKQ
jgi:hypothetical protein